MSTETKNNKDSGKVANTKNNNRGTLKNPMFKKPGKRKVNYKCSKNFIKIKETIKKFQDDFPKTFCLKSPKPLAINIHESIYEHYKNSGEEVGMCKIKKALKFYTSRKLYYSRLREGSLRVDLAGNKSGEVTADEGKQARTNFHKLK